MQMKPIINCLDNQFEQKANALGITGEEFDVINFDYDFNIELCNKLARRLNFRFCIKQDGQSGSFLKRN